MQNFMMWSVGRRTRHIAMPADIATAAGNFSTARAHHRRVINPQTTAAVVAAAIANLINQSPEQPQIALAGVQLLPTRAASVAQMHNGLDLLPARAGNVQTPIRCRLPAKSHPMQCDAETIAFWTQRLSLL